MVNESENITIFNACPYSALASNTHLFSRYEIDTSVWVKLPESMPLSCKLYDMIEIVPKKQIVDYSNNVSKDCSRPWLKLNTSILKLDAGIHIYQLKFIDVYTDNVYLLYIGYGVQDSNPDKPYIYMKEAKS